MNGESLGPEVFGMTLELGGQEIGAGFGIESNGGDAEKATVEEAPTLEEEGL